MRIQIDDNIISQLAASTKPQVSSKQQDNAEKVRESVIFDKDFGKLLEIAQVPPDSTDKVEKARSDLKNGLLDTDEAILSAADNILKYGI